MKLYNTLTRKIEDIVPLNPGGVTVYSCGPTVYDYAHIGHWATYVRVDLLVRALKANGLNPKTVMNITDVGHLVSDADDGEDKLEKGAKREGKTAWEVAEFYTNDFLECMNILSLTKPTIICKATNHIPEQIELIQRLEAKGYTYVIDDGVYFESSKFKTYGDFAHLLVKDLQAGARVAYNEQKHAPTDFALWKFSPRNEKRDMEWESPWGRGFPGWHIECSAMAMKYLGETIDIHTGGIDHIPVHHTNEIAQSEAATDKQYVRHWMHTNHVMVNGDKVSKSLGNGIRLQELITQGYSPNVIRLHILESHYRTQSMFSLEGLAAARARLNDYQSLADKLWQVDPRAAAKSIDIESFITKIRDHIQSDLNSPMALAELSGLVTSLGDGVCVDQVAPVERLLELLDSLLGLKLIRTDIDSATKEVIAQRKAARQSSDYQESDRLREMLVKNGIEINDTANGQIWRHKI